VLFKCEDDRYELDMVIELNCSTIRALEPIMQQIIDTPEQQLVSFKLSDNALDGMT
jgi:paired amphipathic helix protein Sin3a